jgi:hypothetical protein
MDRIHAGIAALQTRERERTYALVEAWRSGLQLSRAGVAAITALNIVLLVLIMRWMKQDWLRARDREQELDRLVQERTSQLANLASYLQEVSETEKTRLGRELHDELGATLTAVKMDVAWTRGKLAPGQRSPGGARSAPRAISTCASGQAPHHRGPAPHHAARISVHDRARELAEQTAERAGWKLKLELPDEDPSSRGDGDRGFRILQDAQQRHQATPKRARCGSSLVGGLGGMRGRDRG